MFKDVSVQEYEKLVEQWINQSNGINLNMSFAYTDHISDVKMLKVVGFPRVVPVDKRLVRFAITKNWPVLPSSKKPELCS